MTRQSLKFVRGDTRPPLYIQLSYDSGAPIDITGSRVFFHLRQAGSTTLRFTEECTNIVGTMLADGSISSTEPYNVAGPGGLVQMDWPADGLSQAGAYEGEVEVIFSDNSRVSVYETVKVSVRPDFGDAV